MGGQFRATRIARSAGSTRLGEVGRTVGAGQGATMADFRFAVSDAMRTFGAGVGDFATVVDVGVVDEFLAAHLTQSGTVGAGSHAIDAFPDCSRHAIAQTTFAISERSHAFGVLATLAGHARSRLTFLVHQNLTSGTFDNALAVDHVGFPTHASVILTNQRRSACALAFIAYFRRSRSTHRRSLIDGVIFEIQRAITNAVETNRMRPVAIFVVDANNSGSA